MSVRWLSVNSSLIPPRTAPCLPGIRQHDGKPGSALATVNGTASIPGMQGNDSLPNIGNAGLFAVGGFGDVRSDAALETRYSDLCQSHTRRRSP